MRFLTTYDLMKSCVGGIEAMCKFQLHKRLTIGDNLSIEEGARLLRGNKVLKAIAEDVEQQLHIKPQINRFLQMQGEIIETLGKQLQGYAFTSQLPQMERFSANMQQRQNTITVNC